MPYKDPEAKRANDRRYHIEHKAKINARSREWRQNNEERSAELKRLWYQANREQHDARNRRWNELHPTRRREIARDYYYNRRATNPVGYLLASIRGNARKRGGLDEAL